MLCDVSVSHRSAERPSAAQAGDSALSASIMAALQAFTHVPSVTAKELSAILDAMSDTGFNRFRPRTCERESSTALQCRGRDFCTGD